MAGSGPQDRDWWPNYVMLKALIQYQEATGDARVIPSWRSISHTRRSYRTNQPLKEWAIYRWHDEVLSVLWLYNRNGDRRLLDLGANSMRRVMTGRLSSPTSRRKTR